MSAREQFEDVVAAQLTATWQRAVLAACRQLGRYADPARVPVDASAELAAITAGGQQLAAAYTGAALATVAEPCDDAVVIGLVNTVRGVTGGREIGDDIPAIIRQRPAVEDPSDRVYLLAAARQEVTGRG